MTKEELEKEADSYVCIHWTEDEEHDALVKEAYLASAEPREKRIEELEEKISVLLSCKNCPENKGGFICAKEYENKCLAQKIEFIKELQEENAELKEQLFSLRNERNTFLAQNEQYEKDLINFNDNLTKAKEIISEWEDSFCCGADYLYLGNKGKELRSKSQKFLNSEVVK